MNVAAGGRTIDLRMRPYLFLAALFAWGCAGERPSAADVDSGACLPNEVVACTCDGGYPSSRVCSLGGVWHACVCGAGWGETPTPPADAGVAVDRTPINGLVRVDTCAADSVVDFNASGERVGATTRIAGSNVTAAADGTLTASCQRDTVKQVAFRYTPRATARLKIVVDHVDPEDFDLVAWVQDRCDRATQEFDCRNAVRIYRPSASLRVDEPIAAGTPIYIIISSYGPSRRPAGTFQISVTEVITVGVGDQCDRDLATRICPTDSVCSQELDRGPFICIADGARNGLCRRSGVACDPPLGCSGNPRSYSSSCRTAVSAGAACDPMRAHDVCVPGSSCVTRAGLSTCVVDGAASGRCRDSEPHCDDALSCSPAGICRTVVAPGAACREASPRCDTDLRCTTTSGRGYCFGTIPLDGACEPGSLLQRCEPNSGCRPTPTATGRCTMATPETEPNDLPSTANGPVADSAVFSGETERTYLDCFGVTVSRDTWVSAEVDLPAYPDCPLDHPGPRVVFYDTSNAPVNDYGPWDGRCARGQMQSRYAGRVTVCVYSLMHADYLLTIGVHRTD